MTNINALLRDNGGELPRGLSMILNNREESVSENVTITWTSECQKRLDQIIRQAKAEAWDEGLWAGVFYHPRKRDFEDMRLDVEPAPPANPYAEEAGHE